MGLLNQNKKMHPVNCGNNLQSAKSLDVSTQRLVTYIVPHLKKKRKNYCIFYKKKLQLSAHMQKKGGQLCQM